MLKISAIHSVNQVIRWMAREDGWKATIKKEEKRFFFSRRRSLLATMLKVFQHSATEHVLQINEINVYRAVRLRSKLCIWYFLPFVRCWQKRPAECGAHKEQRQTLNAFGGVPLENVCRFPFFLFDFLLAKSNRIFTEWTVTIASTARRELYVLHKRKHSFSGRHPPSQVSTAELTIVLDSYRSTTRAVCVCLGRCWMRLCKRTRRSRTRSTNKVSFQFKSIDLSCIVANFKLHTHANSICLRCCSNLHAM